MSTGNDEVQLYQDLKGFLGSDRPDLRLSATEAILHIREREGLEQILQCGIITALAKNVGHPQRRIAVNALQALVFLTSHGTTAQHCIQDLLDTTTASGLPRMLEVVLSAPPTTRSTTAELTLWRKQVNFAMALLVNLTRTEEGAVQLAGQTLPDEAIPSQSRTGQTDSPVEILMPARPILDLLLARFLNEQFVDPNFIRQLDTNEKERGAGVDVDQDDRMNAQEGDPYQHFAAVLMNATQVEAGRRFVMRIHYPQGSTATPQSATPQSPPKQPTSVLQKLLPMLKSRNPLRRRGIAGVIKNCCLDKDSAWWLIHQVKITTHLLYPLAGPEELDVDDKQGLDPDLWLEGPDKQREPDRLTRLYLVESILLLCGSGRKNREQLRLERVYVILRIADMVEEDEEISAQIYECVNYLRGDEEGTAEGSSDKFVQDAYRKPSVARNVEMLDNDFDDVD